LLEESVLPRLSARLWTSCRARHLT
jgi:hypothetical protein